MMKEYSYYQIHGIIANFVDKYKGLYEKEIIDFVFNCIDKYGENGIVLMSAMPVFKNEAMRFHHG